jgi:hypothetical protein
MKGFSMTRGQVEAHQRKHGFIKSFVGLGKILSDEEAAVYKRRQMNQTETEFSRMLETKRRNDEIDGWRFEPVRLKLADGAWYKPDFMSWRSVSSEDDHGWHIGFCEVKGPIIREAAMVRFKVAREQHPWAEFEMWQKNASGWQRIS